MAHTTIPRHFARVEPIVGAELRQMRIALIGLIAATPLVASLAACGVGRWLWADDEHRAPHGGDARFATPQLLLEYLAAQHGPALGLEVATLAGGPWKHAAARAPTHLVIGVGGQRELRLALDAAERAHTTALLIIPPRNAAPCRALVVLPGDDRAIANAWIDIESGTDGNSAPIPPWAWACAAPLCAGLGLALLLRDTPYRRADIAARWAEGERSVVFGATHPFAVDWSAPADRSRTQAQPAIPASPPTYHLFHTPPARRGRLLIAGLGSLGSVAAMQLIDHAEAFVLADPDRVEPANPARQAYALSAIGRPKAPALRDALLAAGAGEVVAYATALTDERAMAELVERHGVTAALVATGTAADFAIARALRSRDRAHVVGRCYPRARYWEAIVVDGRRGPALSDLRGQLPPGPTPPPTPEQIAAYSDAGALEAEPATLVESGWAAAWMARLAAQLLAPTGLRERWLLELLAAERTCLIGGVGVESTPDGPAYAIETPGAIRAWGRSEIGETARMDEREAAPDPAARS